MDVDGCWPHDFTTWFVFFQAGWVSGRFFFLGGPCSETIVSNYKEEVIATMGIVHLRFSSKS